MISIVLTLYIYIYGINSSFKLKKTFSNYHLQNMYEEGDDEMKRTIAKAWTDARSGKVPDPMMNYR